mmetsp:Transcript_99058/g.258791  ORF Transcript_99058/g.258791 Transcript_99058/m.258791 type:complete len:207 (+) Transcript_99058:212-832(+)
MGGLLRETQREGISSIQFQSDMSAMCPRSTGLSAVGVKLLHGPTRPGRRIGHADGLIDRQRYVALGKGRVEEEDEALVLRVHGVPSVHLAPKVWLRQRRDRCCTGERTNVGIGEGQPISDEGNVLLGEEGELLLVSRREHGDDRVETGGRDVADHRVAIALEVKVALVQIIARIAELARHCAVRVGPFHLVKHEARNAGRREQRLN